MAQKKKTKSSRSSKKQNKRAELASGTNRRTFTNSQPSTDEKQMPADVRIVFSQAKGTSGLKIMQGFIHEAYNTQLYWPQVQPLYNKIRRSTPEVAMMRQAFTSWGRSIDVNVELADKPSDDDKKYQEFLYQVFDDMEGGVTKLIDTLVNNTPFYGWGLWEALPGRRNPNWKPPTNPTANEADKLHEEQNRDAWQSEYDDDLIGIRKLAYRDTSTFAGWLTDYRKDVIGMRQIDFPPSKPVDLYFNECMHLTYGDPNNPEGLSPLEAVWRLERLRYGFEVVMGIGFEHSAGHFMVKKTETGTLSADDKADIARAAMAIMTAQEGNYATMPYGMEGELIDVPFQAGTALLEVTKHYSTLMLSVFTMQWMALNTLTGTGSFAAADDSSSISVITFNSMLDGFASQMDEQLGKRLFRWNKDHFPGVTQRPKIGFTHIDKKVALNEMGTFANQMNNISPLGEQDLIALRKRSGFLPEALPDPEEIAEREAREQEDDRGNVRTNGEGRAKLRKAKREEDEGSRDLTTRALNELGRKFFIMKSGRVDTDAQGNEIIIQRKPAVSHFQRQDNDAQHIELSETDEGAMICFRIPENIKTDIVSMYPGMDKKMVDELHITLAFLGDSRTIDKKKVKNAIQSFALMQRPIKGRLQGQARFVGAGDTDVHVALYDSPDMPELYMRLLFCLDNAGVVYSREHGFIPHMTLAYVKKDDELKFETNKFLEINLDMAYCVHGSDWVPYYLIGGQ